MRLRLVRMCDGHVCLGPRGSAVLQVVHPRAAVVAGDIVMEVLPDAFDSIVIRAVWRQEVGLQFLVRGRLQRQPGAARQDRL
jgi:hypothetical protein